MPGLLDLPPELIEEIFDKFAEFHYAEWRTEHPVEDKENQYWGPTDVPPFRSTCRYIRRSNT